MERVLGAVTAVPTRHRPSGPLQDLLRPTLFFLRLHSLHWKMFHGCLQLLAQGSSKGVMVHSMNLAPLIAKNLSWQ